MCLVRNVVRRPPARYSAGVHGPAASTTASPVSAADCYSDPPGLALRHVTGAMHTFTGGSGGAAKTALAASRIAARALLDKAPLATIPHG